jgi:hypothetical protein
MLDQIRRAQGKGAVEETLFSMAQEAFDFDGGEGSNVMEGQTEIRLGPDGPREVPPPSGEEILAERAEAQSAGAAEANEAEAKRPEPKGRRAAKPAADPFTPDGGDAA